MRDLFVQVCEQVTAQLQEQRQENQASFLPDVAQQVAAFLNRHASGGGG